MEFKELITKIKFDDKGLIPCITQDVNTNSVLMMAYMNEESLKLTLESGYMTYFSRSRQELWKKGGTSGNTQKLKSLKLDCDGDTLLAVIEQKGVACHTGEYSCFFENVHGEDYLGGYRVIDELFSVIENRKKNPKEGSYTNYLFDKGIDKILKKVGEEAAEVIIAAKNWSVEEIKYESADLLYHLFVLLSDRGMAPADVMQELKDRR
jgi:phosphoribosyl-AMP cyclohydrolase / phosphoribosyl-ATP pyrophosphohydrolase